MSLYVGLGVHFWEHKISLVGERSQGQVRCRLGLEF